MSLRFSVAIDGPAGSGKSTIAKRVAKELELVYIDTGAMYRTVGLYALKNSIDYKNDTQSLIAKLDDIQIDIKYIDGVQNMFLCGENVTGQIRTEEVGMAASGVAVIPEVRLKLVEIQRNMSTTTSVIMDGRDIGSYVLPNAEVKIFLTASVKERAKRRYDELIDRGEKPDLEKIERDIEARDKNDSTREFAPLVCVQDAVKIDTTSMDIDQVTAKVLAIINQKI